MVVRNRIGKEYNDFCIIVDEPKIGLDTWIGFFTLLDGSGGLEIGDNCSIASGVHIYTHDVVPRVIYDIPRDRENYTHVRRDNVRIGNHVFIGANAVVLKGVTIGEYSVIGAGAVVTKDVPAYSLAYGNPIRIIRNKYKDRKVDHVHLRDETKLGDK